MRRLIPCLAVLAMAAAACGDDGDSFDGKALNVEKLRDPTVASARITADFKVATATGDPVPGLTFPFNFEVYEDGTKVSNASNKPRIDSNPSNFKVYGLVLVDLNGGVISKDPTLANTRTAVKAFTSSLIGGGANRLVAVYTFDGSADIKKLADFTGDAAALATTIDTGLTCTGTNLCADPSSNLNGAVVMSMTALNAARKAGMGDNVLTAGILAIFTDGLDRAHRMDNSAAINAVKSSSNTNSVFTVALASEQSDANMLKELGKDGTASATDIAMLDQAIAKVADRVNGFANSNYRLQYCTTKRTGTHRIEIKVNYTDPAKVPYQGFFQGSFKAVDSPTCELQ